MAKRKVALYLRCTPDELDHQLLKLRSYCNQCNWEIFHEYTDLLTEVKRRGKLPQLDHLLNDASLGLFDIVLFHKLSNFGWQSSDNTIRMLRQLKSCDVHWHFFSEKLVSSFGSHSDLLFEFIDNFSLIESDKISRGTREGLQKAKRRGIRLGRSPIPLETEQQIIEHRKMGESFSQIQKHVSYHDSQGRLRHPSKGSISKILKKYSQQFKKGLE